VDLDLDLESQKRKSVEIKSNRGMSNGRSMDLDPSDKSLAASEFKYIVIQQLEKVSVSFDQTDLNG
jgi:hypothetical protein